MDDTNTEGKSTKEIGILGSDMEDLQRIITEIHDKLRRMQDESLKGLPDRLVRALSIRLNSPI